MELKNINQSPVKCFRWLNVNDKTVELPFNEGTKYTEKYCEFVDNEQYSLKPNEGNTLNKNAGFTLEIKKDSNITEPIIISYKTNDVNNMLVDTNKIIAYENTQATVVINYISEKGCTPTHIGNITVEAKNNSIINIIRVQMIDNNIENINISEESNATVNYTAIDFSKKINMVNYYCSLNGDQSENNVKTIYLGTEKDLLDFNYQIDHKGVRSIGNIETKGILTDKANKTMRATIKFDRGAKKAKGRESEFVMMLSSDVLNNSIPLLICDEDDVSGEHSASIGRIADTTMFYLMSRGLSYAEAKKIIVMGYLNPIVEKINIEEVKESILDEIQLRMSVYE